MSAPPLSPRLLAALGGLASRRRLLAAGLVAVAVVCGLTALRPRPVATRGVWVASRDLSGGLPLAANQLRLAQLPIADVPAGALSGAAPTGRLLAAPVRSGEPLTDVRLLTPALVAAAAPPGSVAVAVRVADGPATVALVHPGDHVDVLAGDEVGAGARTLADGLDVLSVGSTDDGSGLLVVVADPTQAAALARAAATQRLTVAVDREG